MFGTSDLLDFVYSSIAVLDRVWVSKMEVHLHATLVAIVIVGAVRNDDDSSVD